MKITAIKGREILDSRGNPTVEAIVTLEDGATGIASVPSGASTGQFEALELRDHTSARYSGHGVLTAVNHINNEIRSLLLGQEALFYETDRLMMETDGTETKERLGANAILAVSAAVAKAAAASLRLPLYRYLGGVNGVRLPIPMMNILNGGAHASNNMDIQEFMIVPIGFSTFRETLEAGTEIYHTLGRLLKQAGKSTTVGDEGGFAPDLNSEEEAIEFILRAIKDAGYSNTQVQLALDAAASEWYKDGCYILPKQKRTMSSDDLIRMWEEFSRRYPLLSIEDGIGETDVSGWQQLTQSLGNALMLVGDDYFVTNPNRLENGIRLHTANSVLVKPNQIGTLTETMDVIRRAQEAGYHTVLSHRSGDTDDTMIADIAVATNAGFIKTGAPCRFERVAKYNRLSKIEEEWKHYTHYGLS